MGAIYLIRHGQASFGKADYDQLSEIGIEQSRVLGSALRARLLKVDAVYAGAMVRHRQTAEHCLSTFGAALDVRVHAGFNEFDHDEVIVRHKPLYANRLLMMADLARTLQPRRAFQQVFEQATARWVGGAHDAEYRESWPAFRARCMQAVHDVVAQLGPSKTALAFTSGGPVTAICQELLKIPDAQVFTLNRTLANGGITKLVYGERGLHLSTVNEHGHFEGALRELITYR
ncbi:MAG: histidine phosphatase family protein [Pseudomonadota bacterium]